MFNWATQYKGNLEWLKDRTIYLTITGSHAYGTNIPTSDLDIRGICVAPKEYHLGFNSKLEIVEQKDPDFSVFELKKFFYLASQNNPNILELLYTDPKDHLLVTPVAQKLIDNRELFLSQKVRYTFSGYAVSQLKRIKTHREHLLNPVEKQPTRAEFGLPDQSIIPKDQLEAVNAAIRKQTDQWGWKELDSLDPALRQAVQDEFERKLVEITGWAWDEVEHKTWLSAANSLEVSPNFIHLLNKEKKYQSAVARWRSYQKWKVERNPVRAEMERKFFFDLKHGMHLVRLLTMAKEILTTGQVIVKRPDAEFLLSIRNGAWSYDKLVAWAEQQETEIMSIKSDLPHSPNIKKLDKLCVELVDEML